MKFNITTLFSLIILVNFSCSAQKIFIVKNPKLDLVTTLGNVTSYQEIDAESFRINVFKISNGSGSANLKESDEVSYNYILIVSEFDEYSKHNLFNIGPFINPKIIMIKDLKPNTLLKIETGLFDNRKLIEFKISLDSIVVK